jgi:hypothetical protein
MTTFDTLHGHESRPRCNDTVLRYVVALQVCTPFICLKDVFKHTSNFTYKRPTSYSYYTIALVIYNGNFPTATIINKNSK